MIENSHKKVFVDTAPFIYFFDGESKHNKKACEMFLYLLNEHVDIYTSEITNVECRVRPKKNGSINKLRLMDMLMKEWDIRRLMLTKKTYEIALEIRSRYNYISLIDAFQLALAEEGCFDYFVTNDKELLRYNGIKTVLFDTFPFYQNNVKRNKN